MASPGTFPLTEAKVADGASGLGLSTTTAVENPRGMADVHIQYAKLNEVVKNLNEKTKGLLMKERSEFLAAYRAHTYKVQRELKALRQRVAEEESSLQKDEKVKRLREDCEWYRKEALQLDEHTAVLKRELRELKEKLEVYEDDRNWLVRQLKGSKTQTDLLRAALDSQRMAEEHELTNSYDHLGPGGGAGGSVGRGLRGGDASESSGVATLPPALQHLAKGGAKGGVSLGPPAQHLQTRFSNVASVPTFEGLRSKQAARAVDSLQRELTTLKRNLAAERRAAQQLQLSISLRRNAPRPQSGTESAEAIFVRSIAEVRREPVVSRQSEIVGEPRRMAIICHPGVRYATQKRACVRAWHRPRVCVQLLFLVYDVACYVQVRTRIEARKAAVRQRNEKRKGASADAMKAQEASERARAAAMAAAAAVDGNEGTGLAAMIEHLALDEFTASDRVQVMKRVFADPHIQASLVRFYIGLVGSARFSRISHSFRRSPSIETVVPDDLCWVSMRDASMLRRKCS